MGNCNFATEIENPVKQGEKDHGCGREIALIVRILYPADFEIVKIVKIAPDIKGERERASRIHETCQMYSYLE